MVEIFKVIKDFPKYEISNYGRIRYQNKIYNESIDQNGYRYFGIYNFDGDKIIDFKRIHWEVAKAFLPNINNQQIVNHKDGNRGNNNVDNLYYFSIAEEDKKKLLYNKSSSGYRGIQYIPNKMGGKYRIVITENKKSKHIGCYETLEEAIQAKLELMN